MSQQQSKSPKLIAVAGVTGNTGRATAEALLAAGARVRVVVRSAEKGAAWAARGAEVAVADLADRAALAQALRGTDGAFLLLPPQLAAADPLAASEAIAETLAAAARDSGVPHVALLSSVGAQAPSGTGPIVSAHRAEAIFTRAGLDATFVRAAYFLENWLTVAAAAKHDGVLPTFIAPDQRIAMVAVEDIGRATAHALLAKPPRGQAYVELAGARDATPTEVAAAFAAVLGRPVQVAPAPLEAVVPTFMSFGLGAGIAELYAELYRGVAQGTIDFEGAPTRGALDVEAWARTLAL